MVINPVSTGLSTIVAGHVNSRQRRWFDAIQKRVNFTSHILGSMRNIKMLGLTRLMFEDIYSMRESELKISKHYRKIQSLNVSLGESCSMYRMIWQHVLSSLSSEPTFII
jgi:ATP-binding cassette, subfamily C (CFTR/MRP), member 1